MPALLETWRISKNRGECGHCGSEFRENAVFYSWRTRRASVQRKQVVDTELMLEFFDRLKGGATEQKRVFRFVLALYLMRRKELKLLEIGHHGGGLVFERRRSGEKVEVADPSLTEEQIQEAAVQLSRLLSAGLEAQSQAA